jgi:V-type H+-transporting ATPase subunit D
MLPPSRPTRTTSPHPRAANELTGLGKGGKAIQECKKQWESAVKVLIHLGSLQTSFRTLDEVIKATKRRVNAIEHVIIPKIERTLEYIKTEVCV